MLVFVDADVVLAPHAVAASVALLRWAGLDLVSPYPRQLAVTPAERLVQPLLQWSWLTLGHPQRHQRQPGPLQQRLHQPFGETDRHLARVRRDEVEAAPPQQRHRGCQRVRLQHHVGVDEDQHRRVGRLPGELVAGPRLSPPPVGQVAAGEQPHPVVGAGHPAYDLGGAVGRAVVEHQHPQVAHPGLGQQAAQARLDPQRLVAHRQQHRDRLGHRRRVGRRDPQPVQVPRGVHRARDRQAGADPGEHPAHGRDCHSVHP